MNDDFKDEVCNRVEVARASIREALDLAAATGTVLDDKTISLIRFADRVLFVLWTDAATRWCRPITVKGRLHHIEAIVPARISKMCVWGCEVLIHRCPDVMLLRKATEGADTMPSWCMVLHRFYNARLFCGPLSSSPVAGLPVPECVVCVVGAQFLGTQVLLDRDLFTCVGCTVIWHLCCKKAFAPAIQNDCDMATFRCPLCS